MLQPLLMLMVSATAWSADPSEWSVFPGDAIVSRNSQHVHDPTLIEFRDRTFVFQTSGDGFTLVRSSMDLKEWESHGPIFTSQPAWLAERYRHKSVWAPDVVVIGDRLRMYYSVSEWGTNKSVIGLAECENFNPEKPTEGWKDLGLVIESKPGTDPYNAIDAEVAVDEKGGHWMFFGSYFGGIYLLQLNPVTGKAKEGATPTIVARNTADRGNALEGAAVVRRDGFFYLFVSYGLAAQGVRSTYQIMVGRSKDVAGPYIDAGGKSMVDGGHVNVMKGSPPMFAPGHCDALRLKDGRYVMPYHFYDGRRHWVRDMWGMPTLQIRELLWTNDGWPLPGLPIEMGLSSVVKPGAEADPTGKWIHQADFGEPRTLELRQDGTLVSGEDKGGWKRDGNEIVLSWPRSGEPNNPWIDRVQLAYGGRYYAGRTAAGMVVRGMRAGFK